MSLCKDLVLDIKVHIASFNQHVWLIMVLYDKEFYHYAQTIEGKKQFVDKFHRVKDYTTGHAIFLFNYKHSINDKPAEIIHNSQYWCYKDLPHRDNDLPAIIRSDGFEAWMINGQYHRENNLPAIMCNNKKEWWIHGKYIQTNW